MIKLTLKKVFTPKVGTPLTACSLQGGYAR